MLLWEKKILGTVLFPIKPIIDPLLMFGDMSVQLRTFT